MSEATIAAFEHLPVAAIIPDPNNVRVSGAGEQADADLDASVREQGVHTPIMVRALPPRLDPDPDAEVAIPARYMVVYGHRRHAAAVRTGRETIPAVITDETDPQRLRMIQLTENIRRAGMSALDIWAAVAELQASGVSEPTIAATLGRTERDVRRYIAMGSLHPEIQAHIREKGDLPPESHLHVICQASPEAQLQAFKACKGSWYQMANALRVKSVPLSHARFDLAAYTGEVFQDLFAQADDERQATDIEQFTRLQQEWMAAEVERKLRAGFGRAEVLTKKAHYSDPVPAGCKHWDMKKPTGGPRKKSERADWVYAVWLDDDLSIGEGVWPLPKQPEKAAAGVTGTTTPAVKEQKPLTGDGFVEVEKAKRAAAMEAVQAQDDPWNLLAVALLLLNNRAPHGTSVARMVEPDGRVLLDHDLRNDRVLAVAREVLARCIEPYGYGHPAQPLTTVERIGLALAGRPKLPLTPETLKLLNRTAIEALARRWNILPRNTLKETRAAILASGRKEIEHFDLAELGWKIEAPKSTPGGRVVLDESADEDPETDERPEGCADFRTDGECMAEFCACSGEAAPGETAEGDEGDEGEGCPAGDPDCLSGDGECHDACEAPDAVAGPAPEHAAEVEALAEEIQRGWDAAEAGAADADAEGGGAAPEPAVAFEAWRL